MAMLIKKILWPQLTLEICLIKKYSQPGKVGKLDFYFDKGIDFK